MSGPNVEEPTLPEPDPEWLARYHAKMADLEAARLERIRATAERVEAWREVEQRVDEALEKRRGGERSQP